MIYCIYRTDLFDDAEFVNEGATQCLRGAYRGTWPMQPRDLESGVSVTRAHRACHMPHANVVVACRRSEPLNHMS